MTSGRPIVVDDVDRDDVYRDHVSPRSHGFRSFITFPVVLPDGSFFGTLSGIDPDPRAIDTPGILESVRLRSELTASHIQAELDIQRSKAMLVSEKQVAILREQFIAVLGEDLRKPLAGVSAGARMMTRRPERAAALATEMARNVGHMNGLINEVTDFARGRLGGGLQMEIRPNATLDEALRDVVAELQSARPDKSIDVDIKISEAISCDPARIAQLASNLLGNAIFHDSGDVPVSVRAGIRDGVFEFIVTNAGRPLPAGVLETLFEPYARASVGSQGLGLGLYIASEIARGHDGHIDVASNEAFTSLAFRMPAQVVHDEGALLVYHRPH
jgi:signal transduction histidine kinase